MAIFNSYVKLPEGNDVLMGFNGIYEYINDGYPAWFLP